MTDTPAAIQAEFVNFKRLPTRKAFQIILEVPEEHAPLVFQALGYPCSEKSIYVAVARIDPEFEQREGDAA